MFHYNTFRRHANLYIEPAIIHKWKSAQMAMIEKLKAQNNILGGDMRADSPGITLFFLASVGLISLFIYW